MTNETTKQTTKERLLLFGICTLNGLYFAFLYFVAAFTISVYERSIYAYVFTIIPLGVILGAMGAISFSKTYSRTKKIGLLCVLGIAMFILSVPLAFVLFVEIMRGIEL